MSGYSGETTCSMKKISAEIVADSICNGHRITTMLLTFPRFILAEAKTHRIISGLHGEVEVLEDISINSFREGSKNSASSRAIPFNRMVKMVEEDPFIPIAVQRDHKGMQGTQYLDETQYDCFKMEWLAARDSAIKHAKWLNTESFTTKQLCNRLLEPFMWHTVLVTATEFDNFFELRCPQYEYKTEIFKSKKDCINSYTHGLGKGFKGDRDYLNSLSDLDWLKINKSQAEIHIQALAESMWDAMNESTPKELKTGEWHVPFGDRMQIPVELTAKYWGIGKVPFSGEVNEVLKVMIATARCARLSYMNFDGEINYEKDIKLHDQLLESKHYSPFEHCARAMSEDEYYEFAKGRMLVRDGYGDGDSLEQDIDNGTNGWCNNLRGWISYRYIIENEKLH